MSAQIPDTLLEWAPAVMGGSTLIVFAVALQNFFVQPATLTRPQRLLLASGAHAAEYQRYRTGTWRLVPFVY
ncbi:MAG: hypothetical protein AB7P34_10540 [Vicinamibacterales bacterium]